MIRRFQFGMRGLLAVVTLASLCLGGWHAYARHFAQCVFAQTSRVGQPIVLQGRFSLKRGADLESFEFAVAPYVGGRSPTFISESSKSRAERNWCGVYEFAAAATCSGHSRWTAPGDYFLVIFLRDGHYVGGSVTVTP
jgi:hypothetical protein